MSAQHVTFQPSETPSDPVFDRLRQAAALMLWELEAIQVRPDDPFTLASGNRSPIYVNCRRAISEPLFMQLFCVAARRLCQGHEIEFDAVAGGETAGIPYAAYLASSLALPMVYVRKKAKGHGIATRVEGRLAPGSAVLLVEDLITDGGSKVGFLDAVAEAGGRVGDVLVLFDRQQGGAELLGRRGVKLYSVTDRAIALAAGQAVGHLSHAGRASVEDYFDDPAAWHQAKSLEYQD